MLFKQSHTFLILCTCFFVLGCTPSVPSDAELAVGILDKSGDNRPQLEQVIEHYRSVAPDPEKLTATYYLIGVFLITFGALLPDQTFQRVGSERRSIRGEG